MNRLLFRKRIKELENQAARKAPRLAQDVYAGLISLGISSPAPYDNEYNDAYMARLPTEVLISILEYSDRQKMIKAATHARTGRSLP